MNFNWYFLVAFLLLSVCFRALLCTYPFDSYSEFVCGLCLGLALPAFWAGVKQSRRLSYNLKAPELRS